MPRRVNLGHLLIAVGAAWIGAKVVARSSASALPPATPPDGDPTWDGLDNAEQRNAQYGDAFKIPAKETRQNLAVGEYAKLIFLTKRPSKYVPRGERLWVKVTGRKLRPGNYAVYTGTLDNNPVVIRGLKAGDNVQFGQENIIAVAVQGAKP